MQLQYFTDILWIVSEIPPIMQTLCEAVVSATQNSYSEHPHHKPKPKYLFKTALTPNYIVLRLKVLWLHILMLSSQSIDISINVYKYTDGYDKHR